MKLENFGFLDMPVVCQISSEHITGEDPVKFLYDKNNKQMVIVKKKYYDDMEPSEIVNAIYNAKSRIDKMKKSMDFVQDLREKEIMEEKS